MGSLSAPRKMQHKTVHVSLPISHHFGAIPSRAFEHALLNIERMRAFSPHRQVKRHLRAPALGTSSVSNFRYITVHCDLPRTLSRPNFLISSPIWLEIDMKSVLF